MIKLMHVNDYMIDTSQFRPLLNDKIVEQIGKGYRILRRR